MSQLEDFAVIEAIQNGSEKILFRLYDEYRNEFIGWAMNNHQTEIDVVKDIFQDSIITFHQNIKNGVYRNEAASLKTYLFAIGKNKILEYFRSSQKTKEHQNEFHLKVNSNSSVEEENARVITIKEAIASMGEKCRKILILFYERRFDMDTIASEMGFKNRDVAKNAKYKCMKILKTKVHQLLKSA